MKALPRGARVFFACICVLGLGCFVLSQTSSFPAATSTTLGELVIFITLAAFAGGKKLTLAKGLKNEESGSMSFGFAITFAALLRFGPEAAVLVSTACAVSCGFFPKRQPAVQIAFNTALGVIEAFVGGLIFVIANGGSLSIEGAQSFPALLETAPPVFLIKPFNGGIFLAVGSKNLPCE